MPIFDQGYQHWKGPLAGHPWRWLAIARHGVRVQMKSRIVRILILFAWLPAIGLVVGVALWGLLEQKSAGVLSFAKGFLPPDMTTDPRAYRATAWTLMFSFFFKFEMFFLMLLAVVAGPGLISRDLRFNALPLYFARPLTRLDYFLGKLGVIGALVAMVAVVPAVFAYVMGICFCLDLSVIKDTYPVLLGAVGLGLVLTLCVGLPMLALSSLTRRSLYVGIAWAGIWIISGAVGTVLTEVYRESLRRGIRDQAMARWLAENKPPPGVQMYGWGPAMHYNPKTREMELSGVEPGNVAAKTWYRKWQEASMTAWEKAQEEQTEALRQDWRPLVSFGSNLARMADQLLDTESAWVTIGKAWQRATSLGAMFGPHGRPAAPAIDDHTLANEFVLQYPWMWSAGVLAGLLGLSTWTLTRRVKSLDRLK
jgi:ABC-type transport system involved in multi-copper enzyme maturation permease subunit